MNRYEQWLADHPELVKKEVPGKPLSMEDVDVMLKKAYGSFSQSIARSLYYTPQPTESPQPRYVRRETGLSNVTGFASASQLYGVVARDHVSWRVPQEPAPPVRVVRNMLRETYDRVVARGRRQIGQAITPNTPVPTLNRPLRRWERLQEELPEPEDDNRE